MSNKKNKSFFDDKRYAYSDPNFINRDDFYKDLNNPNTYKRIIKDLIMDNISDNDYVYFTHNRFINALYNICINEYNYNVILSNAINYYITDILPTPRIYQNPQSNILMTSLGLSKAIYARAYNRTFVWSNLKVAIESIIYGYVAPIQAFYSFRLCFGDRPTMYLDL